MTFGEFMKDMGLCILCGLPVFLYAMVFMLIG